jgi:hypothetical protein
MGKRPLLVFLETTRMQPSPPKDKETALRTTQIIAGAMILGVLAFGAVATMLVVNDESDAQGSSFIAPLAAGVSLLLLVVCVIVPANVNSARTGAGASETARDTDSGQLALYAAYQTRMIIRFALLEGAAMLNLVAALVDKQPYSVAIAGLMAAIMALLFPTRGRVEAFVRSQAELRELPGRGDNWN